MPRLRGAERVLVMIIGRLSEVLFGKLKLPLTLLILEPHGDVLTAELEALPPGLLDLTGQASLDAWTIGDALEAMGWPRYEFAMSREDELIIHRLRELIDEFPTWQHHNSFGRPQTDERTVLLGLLLRQFMTRCPRTPDTRTCQSRSARR